VDPGFDAHNVLVMEMSLTGPRFEKTAGVAELVRDAEQRVEALPGVESMASTCCLPLEGGFGLPFNIVGRPLTNGPYTGGASWRTISPAYFKVFHIPLIHGRLFNDRDDANSAPVVLINEGLAKQYWKDSDPVGQQIVIGKGVGPEFEEPPRQIIGVVGDVRDQGLNNNPDPIMYVPVSQLPNGVTALNNRIIPLTWVVRTKVAPNSLSADIQKELRAASGGLPVGHIRTMDQVRVESTARTDFNMTLLAVFAGIALVLAAIGIYGLMAYSVQQRIQETGIRMALGASPEDVLKMVVWQGMRLALVGVLLGVGIAIAISRVLASFLFGVQPRDPVTFIVVAAVLSIIALLATYIPALRASRVDPMAALRYE
jgi:putative ABC transport system permease protein